jgi:hypothetical protein
VKCIRLLLYQRVGQTHESGQIQGKCTFALNSYFHDIAAIKYNFPLLHNSSSVGILASYNLHIKFSISLFSIKQLVKMTNLLKLHFVNVRFLQAEFHVCISNYEAKVNKLTLR